MVVLNLEIKIKNGLIHNVARASLLYMMLFFIVEIRSIYCPILIIISETMKKLPSILTILIFSIGFILGITFINDFSKNYKGEEINQKPTIKFNFPTILLNNLKVVLLMLAGAITFNFNNINSYSSFHRGIYNSKNC